MADGRAIPEIEVEVEGEPFPETVEEEAPAPDCAAEPTIGELLLEAKGKVEVILGKIPRGLTEARRLIGSELWTMPRPEELQTIVRIAGDRAAGGARGDMSQRILALRMVSEKEVKRFWNDPVLAPDEIRRRGDGLQEIVEYLTVYQSYLESSDHPKAGPSAEDRKHLIQIMMILSPPREPLDAAVMLYPKLADLLAAAPREDLRSLIPSLTDEEASLLAPAEDSEGRPEEIQRRTCLEVAAVRWLMHEDLAACEALAAADAWAAAETVPAAEMRMAEDRELVEPRAELDGDLPHLEPTPDVDSIGLDDSPTNAAAASPAAPNTARPDGAQSAPRGGDAPEGAVAGINLAFAGPGEAQLETIRRLEEHEVVYRVVSDRLQKLQDAALLSRRKETSEWLVRFRRPLVASYRMLAPYLKSRQVAGSSASGSAAGVASIETGKEDVIASAVLGEIFETAVSDLKPQGTVSPNASAPVTEARRYRRRIARMSVLAGALLIIAVFVRWVLPAGAPPRIFVSPSDFANAVPLSETTSIGTLLFARVSGPWQELPESDRLREVNALARLATERGFDAVHIVDAGGEPVADWDPARGAVLIAASK